MNIHSLLQKAAPLVQYNSHSFSFLTTSGSSGPRISRKLSRSTHCSHYKAIRKIFRTKKILEIKMKLIFFKLITYLVAFIAIVDIGRISK